MATRMNEVMMMMVVVMMIVMFTIHELGAFFILNKPQNFNYLNLAYMVKLLHFCHI